MKATLALIQTKEAKCLEDAILLVGHLIFISNECDTLRRIQRRLLERFRIEKKISMSRFYECNNQGDRKQ